MSLNGFNLLQDEARPPDMWDGIYNWVTNTGRLIVIVVEIFVVIAFVSRIFIDTQTNNLTKKMNAAEITLNSYSVIEGEILELQSKFTNYKQLWNSSSYYNPIITEILSSAPSGPQEMSISVSDVTFNVRGVAIIKDIQDMESAMKESESFSSVVVEEIETQGDQDRLGRDLASFSITLEALPELIEGRQQYQLYTGVTSTEGTQTTAVPSGGV